MRTQGQGDRGRRQGDAGTRTGVASIYCRVSTSGQEDNTSLETQEAACRAFAAEQGYAIAAVYREVHTGAELWERPQLTALREAVRGGQIDAIIAHALDRLSREQAHAYIIDDECERAGVAMLFVTEEFDKTAVGKIIRSVKSFAAELEREKIKERTVRGMRARVASGALTGRGKAIYGYAWADKSKKRLLPDPVTAPIVRDMFAWALDGLPLRRIAERLTGHGVATPTGKSEVWQYTSVREVLGNPAYVGAARALHTRSVRACGRQTCRRRPAEEHVTLTEEVVPPLVGRATFEAVRARLERNKREATRRVRNPESFLLRAGYAICGHCGRPLVAGWSGRERGPAGRYPIYKALGRDHAACSGTGRGFTTRAADLDAAAWARVEEYLLRPERLARLLVGRAQDDQSVEGLATVERLLSDTTRQQGNLAKAIAVLDDREAAAPLIVQVQALGARKRALADEREALTSRQQEWQAGRDRQVGLIAWWRNAAANITTFDYDSKRETFALLGIRARLYANDDYAITAAVGPDDAIVYSASGCIAGTSWTRSASRTICASPSRRSAGAWHAMASAATSPCKTTSPPPPSSTARPPPMTSPPPPPRTHWRSSEHPLPLPPIASAPFPLSLGWGEGCRPQAAG